MQANPNDFRPVLAKSLVLKRCGLRIFHVARCNMQMLRLRTLDAHAVMSTLGPQPDCCPCREGRKGDAARYAMKVRPMPLELCVLSMWLLDPRPSHLDGLC